MKKDTLAIRNHLRNHALPFRVIELMLTGIWIIVKARFQAVGRVTARTIRMHFFETKPFKISEAARRRHSFLTGGTGSGKSEALKFLIRHYETKNTDTAVIILDPHGKLARARFIEI